jgi:hypothetical protein
VSWVYHRAEDGTLLVKRIGGWGLPFIRTELRAWVEASGEPKRKKARVSKEPMGVGGMALHQWVLDTRTFRKMHGDFAAAHP